MPDDDLRFLTAPVVVDLRRLALAREAMARLAARAARADAARRLELDLNDAFLRLQFALVVGSRARARVERAALAALAAPPAEGAAALARPRAA